MHSEDRAYAVLQRQFADFSLSDHNRRPSRNLRRPPIISDLLKYSSVAEILPFISLHVLYFSIWMLTRMCSPFPPWVSVFRCVCVGACATVGQLQSHIETHQPRLFATSTLAVDASNRTFVDHLGTFV